MIPVKCWKKTPIDVGYFPILVGGWAYPSEKWWSSSVGMMTFPTECKVTKFMFQTTNQITIIFPLLLVYSLLSTMNHHYLLTCSIGICFPLKWPNFPWCWSLCRLMIRLQAHPKNPQPAGAAPEWNLQRCGLWAPRTVMDVDSYLGLINQQ